METVASVMIAAGLGLFVLAGFLTGYLPVSHLAKLDYKTIDQIVTEPSLEFIDLSKRYPEPFKKAFGEPSTASFREALLVGKSQYIGEGCWHCHSQYVRPVSNEDQR